MTDKPENPPAFPFEYDGPDLLGIGGTERTVHAGMDLRDWFAGQAVLRAVPNDKIGPGAEAIAKYAYRIADAMLEARNNKGD